MADLTIQQRQSFLEIATEAALAGGAVLLDHWGKLITIEEKGRPGDLVTAADKASESVILEILQRHFPQNAILAEESGSQGDRQTPYLWAIDPLDGTTNYAHQFPIAAVSVALLVDHSPQVGVIVDPFRQELFRAAKGLGATCNRGAIRVSSTPALEQSLLATGFAYDRHRTLDNNYAEFCQITHHCPGVRRTGSAALALAYVACARFDGYWERGLSPWDIAAGIILVQEAGGQVSAYDRSAVQLDSGRIVATNSCIHQTLCDVLVKTTPLEPGSNPATSKDTDDSTLRLV